MKLNIKEIKYIRQSLEYRAEHYATQPEHYKKFFKEIKLIIKKFKALEGGSYIDFKKINKQMEGNKNVKWAQKNNGPIPKEYGLKC